MQLKGESSENLPMHELLGQDKQLKSIRGSLRVEVVKKVQLEERIKKEKCKLEEIRDNPEYDNGIQEDIRCRISKLNDDLSVRQESMNLIKGSSGILWQGSRLLSTENSTDFANELSYLHQYFCNKRKYQLIPV